MAELRQIARYRIETNASTEMAKQKVLHQLWAVNTKNIRKINQMRRDIEEDQTKVSNIATEKQNEIECYEFEKSRLVHKNAIALNRLMYSSLLSLVFFFLRIIFISLYKIYFLALSQTKP